MRFWRVQPRGLKIEHYSETSEGEQSDGLHVLDDWHQVLNLDVGQSLSMVKRAYGDEIVEIEAPRCWENADVEGVQVDPLQARIVARYTWAQWLGRILNREIKRASESTYSEAKEVQWASIG